MNLFIINDGDLHNHVFISNMSSNKCQVCEGEVDRHQFIDDLRVAQLKAEYALNYNQISSNSSVSSD